MSVGSAPAHAAKIPVDPSEPQYRAVGDANTLSAAIAEAEAIAAARCANYDVLRRQTSGTYVHTITYICP